MLSTQHNKLTLIELENTKTGKTKVVVLKPRFTFSELNKIYTDESHPYKKFITKDKQCMKFLNPTTKKTEVYKKKYTYDELSEILYDNKHVYHELVEKTSRGIYFDNPWTGKLEVHGIIHNRKFRLDDE